MTLVPTMVLLGMADSRKGPTMRFDSLTIRRDMPLTVDAQIARMANGRKFRGTQQVAIPMADPLVDLYNWFMAPHTAKV